MLCRVGIKNCHRSVFANAGDFITTHKSNFRPSFQRIQFKKGCENDFVHITIVIARYP